MGAFAESVTTVNSKSVTLPYSESFSADLGSFVTYDKSLGEGLTYVWKIDTKYSCAKASAYVNKNIAAESYLVSPWFTVPADGKCVLTFDQAVSKYFGTVADEAQVWIYSRDLTTTAQMPLTYPEVATDKSFSSFASASVELYPFAGKEIMVAFKYTSDANHAGTWEIKNVYVGAPTTGIDGVVDTKADVNAPVYNLAGQRVNSNAKGILIQNGKKFVK